MTDAPETIWARPDPYEPDWTGDKTLRSKSHVEYRRADLVAPASLPMPPTTAQLMADPRVKALVDAGDKIANWTVGGMLADDPKAASEYPLLCKQILNVRAAIAHLKDHKP